MGSDSMLAATPCCAQVEQSMGEVPDEATSSHPKHASIRLLCILPAACVWQASLLLSYVFFCFLRVTALTGGQMPPIHLEVPSSPIKTPNRVLPGALQDCQMGAPTHSIEAGISMLP